MKKDNIVYIEKAKEKSFRPIIITKNGTVKMKERFLALLLAGVTAVSVGVTSLSSKISSESKENEMVYNYLYSNYGYIENKYGWHGISKDDFGYNHEGMAKAILDSADPDIALYAVREQMGFLADTGYDGKSNIDRVITEMDKLREGEEPYGTFLGYLEAKGTTLEVYENNMPQYVKGEAIKAQGQEKINESGMKF